MRGIGGALTAGLFPASMGVVADIMPAKERAKWIGIVMGGYGAGFIFGPVIGGVLYDNFGFAAPFVISATLGMGIATLTCSKKALSTGSPATLGSVYTVKN